MKKIKRTEPEARIAIRNYLGTLFDLDKVQRARENLMRCPGLNGPPDPLRVQRTLSNMVKFLDHFRKG